MRRVFLLLSIGLCLAQSGDAPVRFIQPVRRFVISGPRGISVGVQLYIRPHAENRSYVIRWNGSCGGSSAKSLDGDQDAAVQPPRPILVPVEPGVCTFVATVYGAGGKLRGRAVQDLTVCGGEDC